MSKEDAARFVADLRTDSSLFEAVKNTGGGLSGAISVASMKGYDVTMDDAKAYLESRAHGYLSDVELGAISAGKGKGPTTTTTTVQSVAVAGSAQCLIAFCSVVTMA